MRRWVATSEDDQCEKPAWNNSIQENRISNRPYQADTGVSDLVQSRDLIQRRFAHNEWVRPLRTLGPATYTGIITPAAGYVIGYDATNGRCQNARPKDPARHTMPAAAHRSLRRTRAAMIVIR